MTYQNKIIYKFLLTLVKMNNETLVPKLTSFEIPLPGFRRNSEILAKFLEENPGVKNMLVDALVEELSNYSQANWPFQYEDEDICVECGMHIKEKHYWGFGQESWCINCWENTFDPSDGAEDYKLVDRRELDEDEIKILKAGKHRLAKKVGDVILTLTLPKVEEDSEPEDPEDVTSESEEKTTPFRHVKVEDPEVEEPPTYVKIKTSKTPNFNFTCCECKCEIKNVRYTPADINDSFQDTLNQYLFASTDRQPDQLCETCFGKHYADDAYYFYVPDKTGTVDQYLG